MNGFSPAGGCQKVLREGDKVLWSFHSMNMNYFHEILGPKDAKVGESSSYIVVDRKTGAPLEGVGVGDAITDAHGQAKIIFREAGVHSISIAGPNEYSENFEVVVS